MHFESDHIYHVFNRGNNSQKIFFTRENYLFFLEKISTYITPFTDILAWCLMPNHFHLMIYIKQVEVEISEQLTSNMAITKKRLLKNGNFHLTRIIAD